MRVVQCIGGPNPEVEPTKKKTFTGAKGILGGLNMSVHRSTALLSVMAPEDAGDIILFRAAYASFGWVKPVVCG